MLRTVIPLVLFLLISPFCSNGDGDNNKTNNFFTIKGEKFSIARAGISDFGIDPSNNIYKGNFLVLLFVTEGIAFNTTPNGDLLLEGTGAIMGLVTFSDTMNYLEDGNYFINLKPPFQKGDVSIGFYTTSFDSKRVMGPYFDYDGIPLLSGKMTVNHSNENTLVTMNMIDEIGNEINTNFEGKLELVSYSIPPKILQLNNERKFLQAFVIDLLILKFDYFKTRSTNASRPSA